MWLASALPRPWQGKFQAGFTTAQNLVIRKLTVQELHILHCAFGLYNCSNCDQLHTKICPALVLSPFNIISEWTRRRKWSRTISTQMSALGWYFNSRSPARYNH